MPISKEELGGFNTLRDFDKGWIVGIIEGEGNVYYDKKRNCPELTVSMSDKDAIERLTALIPTPQKTYVYKNKNTSYKHMYRYRVAGKKSIFLMLDVFPYMSSRRKQRIQEIILDYGGVK